MHQTAQHLSERREGMLRVVNEYRDELAARMTPLEKFITPELEKAYQAFNESLCAWTKTSEIGEIKVNITTTLFQSESPFFNENWAWWTAHVIEWMTLLVIFYKVIKSVYEANSFIKMNRTKVHQTPRLSSILAEYFKKSMLYNTVMFMTKVVLCITIEMMAGIVQNEFLKIQCQSQNSSFTIRPPFFFVQGTGFYARLFLGFLQGIYFEYPPSLSTIDSTSCKPDLTQTEPRGYWMIIGHMLAVALFHFLHDFLEKHKDFVMSTVFNFIAPNPGMVAAGNAEILDKNKAGNARNQVIKDKVINDHTPKQAIIQQLAAKKMMGNPLDFRDRNESIIELLQTPSWYHRHVPILLLSIWAWMRYGVLTIYCQVCHRDIVSTHYKCRNIMFCKQCAMHMVRCPCGGKICADGIQLRVNDVAS